MANLFVETGGNLSALAYKKVVSFEGLSPNNNQHWNAGINNATVTQAFTPSEGGDCEGIVLLLNNGRPGYLFTDNNTYQYSGDVTVKLQENVASVWTDRASVTVSALTTNGALAVAGHWNLWYFKFASPYPITAEAGRWRFSVTGTYSNAGGQTYHGYLNKPASNIISHAVVISAADTPTGATDNIWVAQNQTVVVDQDFSCSAWHIGVDGVLTWQNPPAASYTFAATMVFFATGTTLEIGSAASPIPAAQRAVLNVTGFSGISTSNNYWPSHKVRLYGDRPTGETAKLAADVLGGYTTCTLDRSVEGDWQVGDTVWIFGVNGAVQSAPGFSVTLTGVSGAGLTFTPFVQRACEQGCDVLNVSHGDHCGVRLGNGSLGEPLECILSGVQCLGGYAGVQGIAAFPTDLPHAMPYQTPLLRSVFNCPNIAGGSLVTLNYGTSPRMGPRLRGAVIEKTYHSYQSGGHYLTLPPGSSLTMSDCIWADSGFGNGTKVWWLYDAAVSNVRLYSRAGSAEAERVQLSGAQVTLTGCKFFSQSIGLHFVNCFGVRAVDCLFDLFQTSAIRPGNGIFTIVNPIIGQNGGSVPVGFENEGAYYEAQIEGGVGLTFEAGYASEAMLGSAVRVVNMGGVAGDDRVFWKYGVGQRVGSGLSDTTVRTAGSGRFALRLQPTDSANALAWAFGVPTGDIAGRTMTIAAWVKINSAAFYAGAHQKPRLTVRYDNATDAYAEALATTDWQLLSVTFTPATAYGEVTVTLSGRTDATGTDAYFYVDDVSALYPAGYALNLGGLDHWADGLPVVPPIATTAVAVDVWTVPTIQATGAGTIGKHLLDNLNAPVSGLLTVAKFLGLK